MTDKAQKILHKLKQREALERLKLLNDPERRARILEEFNRSTMDDVGPVGGDQEIKVLNELNEMADLEGNAGRKDSPDR